MKIALFKGCKIPYYLDHYGTSTIAILNAFGVKSIELDFNCCGYPNRDLHFESYILSSARNIALAEAKGLDIVTPCKCCFGSLKHAAYYLRTNSELKEHINSELKKEGLIYKGTAEIKHTLSLLYHDIGVDTIKSKIKSPQTGVKVAAHYGCHALRPSDVVNFDNPFSPTIFEELISVTGAESIEWARRLECCGNPLWEKNNDISLTLMYNKLIDARGSGADCVCTACTYCQLQFDSIRYEDDNRDRDLDTLPSILFTQLLGKSMGLPERVLGLKKNKFQ